MGLILLGAAAMASFTISLFFARYWRTTHDRFFFFFAISFLIGGVERLAVGILQPSDSEEARFYLMRLCSFLLILYAIWDKNRNYPDQRGNHRQ